VAEVLDAAAGGAPAGEDSAEAAAHWE
jgi:hypothetical protein